MVGGQAGFRGADPIANCGFCPPFGPPYTPVVIPFHPWVLWVHSTLVGATRSARETILRPKTGQNDPKNTKHDKKEQKWLSITLYSKMSYGFWVHMHEVWEESHMGS